MGRSKLPAELAKQNLSTTAYLERKAQELVIKDNSIMIPPDLKDDDLKKKYLFLAQKLDEMGVWCVLDNDELARYVVADATCNALNVAMQEAMEKGEIDDMERLQKLQSHAFNQAHSLASSLCLNIMGRTKIPRPKSEAEQSNEIKM